MLFFYDFLSYSHTFLSLITDLPAFQFAAPSEKYWSHLNAQLDIYKWIISPTFPVLGSHVRIKLYVLSLAECVGFVI